MEISQFESAEPRTETGPPMSRESVYDFTDYRAFLERVLFLNRNVKGLRSQISRADEI